MRRILWLATVLALAFPAAALAQRPVPLVLPPGWNDSWFEKLDQGQQPRTVVAVMDFSGAEVLEQRLKIQISDALVTSRNIALSNPILGSTTATTARARLGSMTSGRSSM